jgi:CelD/BcsL family acetyltransferase involved in cellulose biosynthesis
VPLDAFRPATSKSSYALVLARICPEKGVAPALAAARRAGIPMIVCGAAFPYPDHLRYLEDEVRPLLDGERRFLGPVGRAEKAKLLAAARCLVVPSLAPETSSLVAMEALASGSPVVGRRTGALPEIVEDGLTGFLVDGDDELGEAIRDAARLAPAACRRAAERRFSGAEAGRRWVALLERFGKPVRRAPRRPSRRGVEAAGVSALEAMREEWSALCDRAAGATPFQRPEWLIPYCRAFGVERPVALTIRERGKLVALAPVVTYPDGGRRVVTLLGGGISDYQDALVDPAWDRRGDDVLDLVSAFARRADALLLEHLPAASPLRSAASRAHGVPEAAPDGVCPVLALPPDASRLEAALDPRLAENLRYARRRLARAGAVLTTAREHDLDQHLEALFSVHEARWSARGRSGVLAAPALRRFHAEVARGMHGCGALRLHVLWLEGRPIAAFHGFSYRGRVYYYIGGFDPAHRAASPGTFVIAHAVEAAIAEGAREFDFLRGPERYKYEWGARDQLTWRRELQLAPSLSTAARGPSPVPP